MIKEILDKISQATERGLTRKLVVEGHNTEKSLSKYPYSALPPFFPERERQEESDRVIFSVETWDGRNVMSVEVKD